MERKILIPVILILIAAILVWAFLSHGRAGGEISFSARIDRVENGIAYATVLEDGAGWFSEKLPEQIEFPLEDFQALGIQVGDRINGCYLSGTIEGSQVRVVSILVIG